MSMNPIEALRARAAEYENAAKDAERDAQTAPDEERRKFHTRLAQQFRRLAAEFEDAAVIVENRP
jgi:thymidylate kinase